MIGIRGPVPGWILLMGWGILILWMSLIPSPPNLHDKILGWDKLQHAAGYAMFTLLAGYVFVPLASGFRRAWYSAAGAAIVYGAFMEVVQGWFTTSRTAEFGDVIADATGAFVVLSGAFLVERLGYLKRK